MREIIFTIFDVFNLILVFFLCGFTLKKYKVLPQKIPIHFDFEGKADHFGSKRFVFLFPLIGVFFYIGFYLINLNPELTNNPVRITESNKETQFFIGGLFLKWILLIVLFLFLNIQDYIFRYSFDEKTKFRIPIWVPLVLLFFSIITFIITSSVNK